jgi:hypothetical protein
LLFGGERRPYPVAIDEDATFPYDLSNQKRCIESVIEPHNVNADAELV